MKIATLLVTRNNSRHLLEWFAWYHMLGVDSFVVCDHGSWDNSYDIIKRLSNHYDIRHQQTFGNFGGFPAWENFMKVRASGEFDWLVHADTDEFYFPVQDNNLKDVLIRYQDMRLSSLGVYWVMYGNNGHIDWEPGLVTECFTRRGPMNHRLNHHIKSIFRGGDAGGKIWDRRDGHCLGTEFGTYDTQGRLINRGLNYPGEITHDVLRINHYWAKSLEYFRTVKQPTGQRSDRSEDDPGVHITEEFWWSQNLNDEEDTSAWDKFGVKLKERYNIMKEQIGL